MKRLLIIFALLMAASAVGQVEVTVTSVLEWSPPSFDDKVPLHYPNREQIMAMSEDDKLVLYTYGSSGNGNLWLTTDDFTSWSDTLDLYPYIGTPSDHVHFFVANDTIWVSSPGSPSTPQGYVGVIDCTADTFLVVGFYGTTLDAAMVGGDNGNYKYGSTFAPLPDDDSGVVVWRSGGSGAADDRLYDVSANWTTDFGSTMGTRQWVADMNQGTHSDGARTGLAYYDNSLIAGLFFRDSKALIKKYNRSTQAWDLVVDTIFDRSMQRWYSFNVLNDTTIYYGVASGNDDSLLYAALNKGDGSWTTGVLVDSGGGHDRFGVDFSEIEYTKRMIAVFEIPESGGSNNFYARWFAEDSLTPSDTTFPIMIGDSIATLSDRFAVPKTVPVAHGDVTYMYYSDPVTSEARVLRLDFSDAGTSCGSITLSTDAQATAVTDTMITVVVDYAGCGATIDQITLIQDTDNNITGASRVDSVTAGITDPDTLVAGGLTKRTGYYFWAEIQHSGGTDTSSVYTDTTDHTTIYSATRVFTSADDDDTLVIYGTKLEASGSGWTQSSTLSNVHLLLGEDTLMFGADSGDGYTGITFNDAGNDNIKIRGGWVIHAVDPDADTSYGNDCTGIHLRGHGHRLDSTRVKIAGGGNESGEASFGIYINGTGTYCDTLYDVKMWNYADFFYRRVDFSSAAFKLHDPRGIEYNTGVGVDTSDYFHFVMKRCSVWNYGHCGIVGYGRAFTDDSYNRVKLESTYVFHDIQNRGYPKPSSHSHYGTANGFAIQITHLGGGSVISGNTIRSGTDHGGGRGMFLGSHRYTTAPFYDDGDDTIRVYDNDIDVTAGNDNYYDNYAAYGIMIQDNNIQNLHLKGNTVIARADTTAATLYSDSLCAALAWNPSGGPCEDNLIEENYFAAYGPNSSVTNYMTALLLYTPEGYGDTTTVFRNNVFASQGVCVRFGNEGVLGTNDNLLQSDTMRFLPGAINPVTLHIGYGTGNSSSSKWARDIRLLDTYFEGATAYDDTSWQTCCEDDIKYLRTCTLLVVDTLGVPIENVVCSLWNNYGNLVMDGTTPVTGYVSDTVAWQYYAYGGYAADSTGYNEFTAKVILGTDSTIMDTITITAEDRALWTIELAETEGAGVLNPMHSITFIDTQTTSITLIDSVYNVNTSIDSIWWYIGTTPEPSTPIDSSASVNSPTAPDTLEATMLSTGTLYYFMAKIKDAEVYDSSQVVSKRTLTPAEAQLRTNQTKGVKFIGEIR